MEKKEQLQTQSIPKLIGTLSAPAILSMLINSVNMAIDKIFVARGAGILALSGVTVSLGVYLVLQGFRSCWRQEAHPQSLLDWEKMIKKALKK